MPLFVAAICNLLKNLLEIEFFVINRYFYLGRHFGLNFQCNLENLESRESISKGECKSLKLFQIVVKATRVTYSCHFKMNLALFTFLDDYYH